MNLISCPNCGIVFDKKVLFFPHDIYDEGGSVNDKLGTYDTYGERFYPHVVCSVCNEGKILDKD